MEAARSPLSLFGVQDCRICSLQEAARVLCSFSADLSKQAALPWPGPVRQVSPARGLLSAQSYEVMGVLGRGCSAAPTAPRERERVSKPLLMELGDSVCAGVWQLL